MVKGTTCIVINKRTPTHLGQCPPEISTHIQSIKILPFANYQRLKAELYEGIVVGTHKKPPTCSRELVAQGGLVLYYRKSKYMYTVGA